jgi:hypothetical protein
MKADIKPSGPRPSAVGPTKALVVRARNDEALIGRLRAQAEAEARPPDTVHYAVRHLIPATFTPGALGWSIPVSFQEEMNGRGEPTGRVAVVAEETFTRGKPDFAGAADKLPDDWIVEASAPNVPNPPEKP